MTALMLGKKTYVIQDDWNLVIQNLTEDKKIIDEVTLTKEEGQKLKKFLEDFYV